MGLAELFDISLDWANDFYTWGWRLSVFGAVLTMIGVAALWMGTRVRDRDFEIQMTTVNLASSQALERAGTLERDAATIRERAANAELKLEQLRKDLRDVLIKELTGQPMARVEIMYLQDDPECFELAQQIGAAIKASEWPVDNPRPIPSLIMSDLPTSMSVDGQPSGVTIVVSGVTHEEADATQNAMLGRDWIKTPWTVLMHAMSAGLGKVSGHAGGPNAPPQGVLRIVVAPRL